MRRLWWIAVGATGGIVAYRQVERALAQARERGVVVTVQQAGSSAAAALGSVRQVAEQARSVTAPTPGAAAAAVLRTTRRGE